MASSKISVDLLDIIKCVNCKVVPTAPIVECDNGHMFYGTCLHNLTHCTDCPNPTAIQTVQSHAMSRIVNNVRINCRFIPCTLEIVMANFDQHIQQCEYRLVHSKLIINLMLHHTLSAFVHYLS